MSYVQPDSIIKLCKGVGVDPSYTNTVYFSSDTARYNYFNSKTVQTHTAQSYANVSDGVLRIGTKYELIYDCDYIMFQNTSFGNKWFYGFITDIKRLNGGSVTGRCDVSFEIDVIQTYFKLSDLEQCYVIREHSTTDNVGDNIVNENIKLGDYVEDFEPITSDLGEYNYFVQIAYSFLESLTVDRATMIGNLYDGFNYKYVSKSGNIKDNINQAILALSLTPTELVSVIQAPFSSSTSGYSTGTLQTSKRISGNLDGYTPKNKKLYTYPYNYLTLWATDNSQLPMRYEFFSSTNCTVYYAGALSNRSTFNFRPQNYKTFTDTINVDMGVTCNVNSTPIFEYLSQSLATAPLAATLISAPELLPIASTAAQNNLVNKSEESEISTTSKAIRDNISGLSKISTKSGTTSTSTNGARYGTGNAIFFIHKCQNSQILRQIDDYFTRYGYAVNRLKTPNINARPHWTYVQTQDCAVKTNAPVWARDRIAQAFNNGITWWKNASEIGNFSLDNSV